MSICAHAVLRAAYSARPMPEAMRRTLLFPLALAIGLTLLVGSAAGATRYAAPGGTGADPCASQAAPCSIYTAAAINAPGTTVSGGDVVELAPGTYSEAAGDLGPNAYVQPLTGITIRGEVGAPRPLIKLEANSGIYGAFLFFGGTLRGVEIVNEAPSGSAITIAGQSAVVEGLVARSPVSSSVTCGITEGLLRDSVCLNEAGGIAAGAGISTFAGTHPVALRNVTAVATGPGSVGLEFAYFGSEPGVIANVSGKSVIARGESKDVRARGMSLSGTPGTGAAVTVDLDHSAYETTDLESSGGGSAFITQAGSNENITAAPLLAADGYHQLEGSPTRDEGAVDGSSGSADIDGQLRTLGAAPDIGADEIGAPTATAVTCPASVFGPPGPETATCTATVTDTSMGAAPTGVVVFQVRGLPNGGCNLVSATATSSSCEVEYTPTAGTVGPQAVAATYGGDIGHTGSDGETTIAVLERPSVGGGGGGGGGATGGGGSGGGIAEPGPKPPVDTLLAKRPAKQTRKRLAKFTFSAVGEAVSFECKLDRRPFAPCTSPFRRRLAAGPHIFQVRAVGLGSLPDPTPEAFHWRILPRD